MNRAVAVIGIAFLLARVASAQVHIRESVTITPIGYQLSGNSPCLIAPKSGSLLMNPWEILYINHQMSDSASLKVIVNDSVVYIFRISPDVESTSWFQMDGGTFYEYACAIDSSLTIRVNRGDSIGCVYHDNYDATVDPNLLNSYLDLQGGWVALGSVELWYDWWWNAFLSYEVCDVDLYWVQKLDHFDMTVSPDTIAHSDTGSTLIYVQAKDSLNQNMDYFEDVLVSSSPTGYGDLGYTQPADAMETGIAGTKLQVPSRLPGEMVRGKVGKNKNTAVSSMRSVGKDVATNDGPLQLGYWYANNGYLYYAPDGIVPPTNTTVTFTISAVDQPSATGRGSVVIRVRVQKFYQFDTTWAGNDYDDYVEQKKDGSGDSTDAQGNKVYYSIGSKGCALTCMAMVAKAGGADTDPGRLERFMEDNNGFDGNRVKWDAINNLSGYTRYELPKLSGDDGLQYDDDGKTIDLENSTPIDLSRMDTYLSNGALIIAQVCNPSITNPNSGSQHWVLITDKSEDAYEILDPGYAGRSDIEAYNSNVYKFVVYQKK